MKLELAARQAGSDMWVDTDQSDYKIERDTLRDSETGRPFNSLFRGFCCDTSSFSISTSEGFPSPSSLASSLSFYLPLSPPTPPALPPLSLPPPSLFVHHLLH